MEALDLCTFIVPHIRLIDPMPNSKQTMIELLIRSFATHE
jgi:hypothetical protein